MYNKSLEESFVVLGSASLLRQPPGPPSPNMVSQPPEAVVGLDDKLQSLAQLFELASSKTSVEHPLCLDCAAQLKDEVDAQTQQTEKEIALYSAAVAKLEAERTLPMDEEQFQRDLERLLLEEAEARLVVEGLQAELTQVEAEVASLGVLGQEVDALEERYWHDFNHYQLELKMHVEERDALLNKIDSSAQRLQLVKSTNVYNDVFKIWHNGPFGTISGFRLGRTPDIPVDWEEINAAWGQAVLLLHTMAQACKLTFSSYRLQPMGSHPRISDKRTSYDLFGPVSKLWSANYDRAMVAFLTCLKEFGDFARNKDRLEGRAQLFEFPFTIDNDRVGNLTVKLTLNKDAKWTKALKFMLADLKVALQWMVKNEAGDVPQLSNLGPEGPSMVQ